MLGPQMPLSGFRSSSQQGDQQGVLSGGQRTGSRDDMIRPVSTVSCDGGRDQDSMI